jgi:subtilisin family serine protease
MIPLPHRPLSSIVPPNKTTFSLLLALALAASVISIGLPRVGKAQAGRAASPTRDDANRATPAGAFDDEYVAGEVLVSFQPGIARAKIDEIRSSIRASVIKELSEIRVQQWRLAPGLDVARAVEVLSSNPNVKYAEPNYIVSADQLPSNPDDAYRSDLWAMHNLGQSAGTTGADINAPEAWQVSTGSQSVVIGVVDTGIDYNHPDLQNNIWANPGETGLDGNGIDKATNGIDDDGNGYIDDVRGWDFVNNDNDPMDDNGHGTHTSGTIGAEGNNSIGVVGVNWHVRLMPLKFLNAGGSGDIAAAASAILYAAKFKDGGGANVVRVTSNSWSGGKRSSTMQNAIASSGALFVAAAGNNGSNQAVYPAGYSNDNIISVAATDHNDNLASFSNYSSNWVDLGAPGVNIISTYRDNQYRSLSGTSMATPLVAGVAGLIMAGSPGLTNSAVKARILNTVDPISALAGKTVSGGRLNAGRALQSTLVLSDNCNLAPCSPDSISDLSADDAAATPTSITLHMTATGDDGVAGAAYLYDVRYSTSVIDTNNFSQATVANGEPVPKSSGVADSITVTGLKPDTTYYFGLRVADEVGNYSGLAMTSGKTAMGTWSISVLEDITDNVGFYASLAYDKSANPSPSLAYSDETADDVKLVRWDGNQWHFQTVDAGSGVRTGISLAYDPTNNPSVSYGWGKLYFAQFVPTTQSWQITVVESKNAYNDVTSLAYAPDGNPSISYRTSTASGRGSLKFARKTSAGWTIQTVDAAGARYNSLAYDSAGNPSIAFSDDADGDGTLDSLKFARWNGSAWVIQTVETGVAGYGVMASLAYDNFGNPAIAHRAGGVVRFVRWNGTSWDPAEIVGSGTNCSLVFNSSDGNFYVSYSDETNLKLGKQDISHWTTELIDIGVSVRWIAPLAISPCATPSMGYSTYPTYDLKFASKCPLPGP